jgi:elongation factor G
MKPYDEKHIKNIALIGAAKSGKTTLAETMMFEAGLINRRGTVEEKNTVSDYHEIEHARGNSVYATLMHTEWKDYKINIIDTPGLDDFIGEVISSIRVCDTAVLLLNAQNGVEVGTELLWNFIDKYRKPTIIAVNQVDHAKSDFFKTVEQARYSFGNAVTLMQYPLEQGPGFNAIIDLLKMTMYKFGKDGGKPEKLPIPDSEMDRANDLHNKLVEKAAENDEKLMELFFEKGNLNEDELREGIKIGMINHDVFPVFCMSAKNDMGSGRLMGFIDNVSPSAVDAPPEICVDGSELKCDPSGPPSVFIFKTLIEPHLGRLSLFKVTSGEISAGMEMTNDATGVNEKLNQLFIIDGKNRNPIDKLKAGDIGATLKLKAALTNHTLNGKSSKVNIKPIDFPPSRVRVALIAKNKGEEEKIGAVLPEIHASDQTIIVEYNRETKQVILQGQGDLHLQVTKWRIEHFYELEVDFIPARIPYRETILKPAVSVYRHKKQSGGAGQFGEVHLKIEPFYEGMPQLTEFPVRDSEVHDLDWGGKLVFNNCIQGGVIDNRFMSSILKGVMEKMNEGPLTGSYVRDVRLSVFDGKMHPVDSNDISFKIAGMMAFKDAFNNAQPQLLEPIYEVTVGMPEMMMGDVMTELQTHRSIILGMEADGIRQVIKARIPLAEIDSFAKSLRQVTQGRGTLSSRFLDYEPVPVELQKKLTEEYAKNVQESR